MVNTNVQFRIVKSGESYNRVWIGSLPKNPNNTVLRQNFDRCDRLVGSTTSSSLTTAELSACVPLTVGRTVPNNNQTLDAGDYNLLISSVTAPPPPTTTTTNTSSSTDRKTRTNNKTTTSNVNFVPNTVNYATVADQNLVSNLLSRSQVPGQQTNINSPDPATNIVTKTQITTTVGITIRTNRFDTPSGNVLMNNRFNQMSATLQKSYPGITVKLDKVLYSQPSTSMGGQTNQTDFNIQSAAKTETTTKKTTSTSQQTVLPCN